MDSETGERTLLVPSSYSRIIARVVGLQEKALPRLLQGTDLPAHILQPGDDSTITAAEQMRVLENAIQISHRPEIGLMLGQSLQPASHGPMGYLVLSSPTVMSAIEAFVEFLPLRFPFSQVEITSEADEVVCTLSLKVDPATDVRRLLQECFALMLQSVVASVLGRTLTEAHIALQHEEPEYSAAYLDYFDVPIEFGAAVSSFRLPISTARMANAFGHSDSYTMAYDTCMNLLEKLPTRGLSTTEQVRRLLLMSPMGSMSADTVANSLFITKRTLQRRLDKEQTSYREITESLLSELASRHLLESSVSVEALATMLGYCDSAAFRKAFRRWFATSPNDFRKAAATTSRGS